jgi:hypothetical protein
MQRDEERRRECENKRESDSMRASNKRTNSWKLSTAWFAVPMLIASAFYSNLSFGTGCPVAELDQYEAVHQALRDIWEHRSLIERVAPHPSSGVNLQRDVRRFFAAVEDSGAMADDSRSDPLFAVLDSTNVRRVRWALQVTRHQVGDAREASEALRDALDLFIRQWPRRCQVEEVPVVLREPIVIATPESAVEEPAPAPAPPAPAIELDPACARHISQAQQRVDAGHEERISGGERRTRRVVSAIMAGLLSGEVFEGVGRIRCELLEVEDSDSALDFNIEVEWEDSEAPAEGGVQPQE